MRSDDDQELDAKRSKARAQAQQDAKQEIEDIAWLMNSKRGRRILWRRLSAAGVFSTSFHTNSMQMAFNEGGRNQGLQLLALIQAAAPDLYPTMAQENTNA